MPNASTAIESRAGLDVDAEAECVVRRMCAFYLPERYDMADSLGHQLYRLMVGMKRESSFE